MNVTSTSSAIRDDKRHFSGPTAIAFDLKNGRVYVINSGSKTVSVISSSTNNIIKNIPLPKTSNPTDITFDSFNGKLYVVDSAADNILVISGHDNKIIATIHIPAGKDALGFSYQYQPSHLAADSKNGNVFVVAFRGGMGTYDWDTSLFVINGKSNQIMGTIDLGIYIMPGALITYDSVNNYLYISNRSWYVPQAIIYIVNASNNKIVTYLYDDGSLPQTNYGWTTPVSVDVNPRNGNIYVLNSVIVNSPYSCTLWVFDGTTNKLVAREAVGSFVKPIAGTFDLRNQNLYIIDNQNVTVISSSNYEIEKEIKISPGLSNLVVDPENGNVYVTNSALNTVSVINGYTNEFVKTIQ